MLQGGAGRMDEARAFAERFRTRDPHSLLRAAVDYALGAWGACSNERLRCGDAACAAAHPVECP